MAVFCNGCLLYCPIHLNVSAPLYLCKDNWVVCKRHTGYVAANTCEVSLATTDIPRLNLRLSQATCSAIEFSFLEEMKNSYKKLKTYCKKIILKILFLPWVLCSCVYSSYPNCCIMEMYIPSNLMWSVKAFVNQSVLFSENRLKYCWTVWWNTFSAIGVFLHFCIDF